MDSGLKGAEFEAWGGIMRVVVTDPHGLAAALQCTRRTIAAFDQACSSFRDDSELAQLNAAEGRPLAASPLLLDAAEAALRAAQVTDGAVDPTVGEALVAYGFGHAGSGAPIPPSPGRIVRVAGYRTVELDRTNGTIRIPRGVRLDLGATAKALAADRAAAAAHAATGAGVLVSLAGDIALAGTAPQGGWSIRVADDHRAPIDAPGQSISLREGGLATSSTTVRVRPAGHHVIDPSTGRPAAVHFRTVSVAAASCLDANIASTASIIRGEGAVQWLRSLGLPGRLVGLDGTVRHVGGWPAEGEGLTVVADELARVS